MKKDIISQLILILLFFVPCLAFAQYNDHRDRKVDSLENVLATNQPIDRELATIYAELKDGYQQINTEKSTEYAWKCIDLSVRFNLLWNVVTSYGTIGVNFYHISQFDSAMVYYEKALEATERMKDFPKKYDESYIDDAHGIIYGSMGNLFNIQGRYTDAIACYQKVFTICEKYGWKQKQALIYSNIGEVYAEMENYEQAEINYVKLDSIAHEINDSLFIVLAKEGLSLICMHYCDYDKALENANIANDYYFSHPEEEGIARIRMLNLLSQIYLEGYGDDRRVEEYVRQALALLVELDFPQEKAVTLRVLSSIYLKRDQWRQAEKTAIEALAIDDSQLGNTLALYEILSKACSHQGNSDKAGEYFDKFKALQSSWSTKNYQSAIREMEVKYETGKKELEIERQQRLIGRQNMERLLLAGGVAGCLIILALLWRLLRLRTRHNRDLAEMNLTKDKFFSIISHDLKNPALSQRDVLQVLVKNARSWDADTLADYHNELLKSAEGQIELIYNLLSWSKLQTGRMAFTPETFMLSDLFPNLTLIRNMAEHKNITLTVRIPEHALVTGDINILSTVVRNLLTNAVKFTPPGGQVTLEASPFDHGRGKACLTPTDPKGYTISVSDTGIGMTCEQVETLRTASLSLLGSARSRQGTASEQGSGLGLIVCLELLEKHGSELHVESEEGKGSRFWFEIN